MTNTMTPVMKADISIPFSFKIKDPVSAGTHFLGAIAAIVALPFMIERAVATGADGLSIFGSIIFVLSMFLLYGASATYHTVVVSPEANIKFKKVDHMMIFILIAGTYTPICLTALRDSVGFILLAAIWGLAFLGMIFKFCWVTCPKWVSSTIYIAMGWLCVFAFPQIYASLSLQGFLYLLAGGIIYTVGGVIYALKAKLFNSKHTYFGSHEIFHLFVMAGNLLQFICIYHYVFAI